MEVKVSELKETLIPLKELEPYPKEKPIGFEDKNNQFMVAVLVKGIVMKKRIPRQFVKHNSLDLPDIELCDF